MAEISLAVEAELARLRAENARLLKLLQLSPQQAAPPGPAQGAFFEAAPGIVHHRLPQDAKVAFLGALFAARTDVYAVRYDNPHTGKGGWIPAVRGGWRKGVRPEDRNYLPLTPDVLAAHLKGETHIGLYPLLDGDRCWWLAADFDGAMFDALMYVKAGRTTTSRSRCCATCPLWPAAMATTTRSPSASCNYGPGTSANYRSKNASTRPDSRHPYRAVSYGQRRPGPTRPMV